MLPQPVDLKHPTRSWQTAMLLWSIGKVLNQNLRKFSAAIEFLRGAKVFDANNNEQEQASFET